MCSTCAHCRSIGTAVRLMTINDERRNQDLSVWAPMHTGDKRNNEGSRSEDVSGDVNLSRKEISLYWFEMGIKGRTGCVSARLKTVNIAQCNEDKIMS